MKILLPNRNPIPALLRSVNGVDAQKTKSLCCVAAGITALFSATAKTRIPHEKLRRAAKPDATLIAPKRPPAQPFVGYTCVWDLLKLAHQANDCRWMSPDLPAPKGAQS